MIVVFSINWSRMFPLYVLQMCCKLELKTLNNRKMTASLRNHWKRSVCSDPCICTTQRYLFFQQSFAQNLKNISPIIWYCCNTRHPYKISNILYKTNEKAVSFLSTTSGTSHDLSPSAFIFLAAWHVFVQKHRKVCCSLLQWCDVGTVVWCRTCTVRFFRSLFIFKFSADLGVRNESTVKSGIFPHRRFETHFFILGRVQREGFRYNAISCQCYVQLLIQDVYSISSKTCQL